MLRRWQDYPEEGIAFIDDMIERGTRAGFGTTRFIWGHSMGGATAIYGARPRCMVDCLIKRRGCH